MKPLIYKSKVDWWVVFVPFFIIGAELLLFVARHMWIGIIILGLVTSFILTIFIRTIYVITGNTLIVTCGFIINYRIDIGKIYSIKSSSSFESAPALSIDRISIHYNDDNGRSYVLISPKDKNGFIKALQEKNSAINVVV